MNWQTFAPFTSTTAANSKTSRRVRAPQQPQITVSVIVVLKDNASFDGFATQYRADDRAQANPAAWSYVNRGVAGAVQSLERRHGFRSEHIYSAAIRGFSARLSARQIADLQGDPIVSYVELDATATAHMSPAPRRLSTMPSMLSELRQERG